MTLNDIIASALAQLDRGHDPQSLELWREKLTRFANEALVDLANAYKPRRTETVFSADGLLDANRLARGCISVLGITRSGQKEDFSPGGDSGILRLANGPGKVEITYRCAPAELRTGADVPELPAWCHGLIVCYVVGRERAAGDVSVQRGGNIYFQMYESGKAAIRSHLGDAGSFRILNRW